MKHILGGIQVEAPGGMDGAYFEKAINNRFFSVMSKNVGRILGLGEINFDEPVAVQVLDSAWESKGVDASVDYQLIDDTGTTLVDSEINFANCRWRPNWWSVTFRDSEQMQILEKLSDKKVSIAPNKTVTLEPVVLAQEITHTMPALLARYAWKGASTAKSLTHYPAFEAITTKADATGDFATVLDPSKAQAVWVNTTPGARLIEITSRLVVSHRSATASAGKLVCYVINGNTVTTYPIVDVVVGTSLETKTYIIEKVVNVPQGGELYIALQDFDNTSADFEFEYDAKESYLCVNQDKAVPSSTVRVISCADALRACCAKIAPSIAITNEVADLDSDWITNGYQLRGITSALIKISFGELWDDLNRLHCLVLVRTGPNQLSIRKRTNWLEGLGTGIEMKSVGTYELSPALDLLYSRIMVGYDTWQSYTPTGNEEIYGNEEFSTGLSNVEDSLNLTCYTLTASQKLIESVRRMQFYAGGSNSGADERYDEKVFIKGGAITPSDSLANWECIWAVSSGSLEKTSGMPDNSPRTISGASRYFTGETASVQGVLSGEEWAAMGNVLTFYDGGLRYRVLVTAASYRPGAAGSGADDNTMVLGWVLKD